MSADTKKRQNIPVVRRQTALADFLAEIARAALARRTADRDPGDEDRS